MFESDIFVNIKLKMDISTRFKFVNEVTKIYKVINN